MLTHKQHRLLMFIHKRLDQDGVPPSYEEMREALGLKSKSGVHRFILSLVERGFIRRLPHKARALEIVRLPWATKQGMNDDISQAHQPSRQAKTPLPLSSSLVLESAPDSLSELAKGAFREDHSKRDGLRRIPFYGRIAAGVPIEAVRDDREEMDVPVAMLAAGGDYYALSVQGESMINAGIHDGDVALIRHSQSANNGQIIVALIEGEDATLKRLYRRGDTIALESANPAFETRIFQSDQVKIQGNLAWLMRRYR